MGADYKKLYDENKQLRAELAEKNKYIQEMVRIAAEKKLDGYRELGQKCADLETRAETAEAEVERLKDKAEKHTQLVVQGVASVDTPLDCIAVRRTLEKEISSKGKYIELLQRTDALDAAARENAVREGISWALFVLHQKHGI